MPLPKKNKKEKVEPKKTNSKKTPPPPASPGKLQIAVAVPSLSGVDEDTAKQILSEVRANIYNSINDAELQRALDKWFKDNQSDNKIQERDYHLLKSVITEYLDSYILLGYNTKGERILIQHVPVAKDQDAIMEFLKHIFVQQQNQYRFLDEEEGET